MPLQILFVDDSVTMQRAMQITFSREDAQVTCANDGAAALAQARQVRPDVIIIDVALAQEDGYTVCQSLKADTALAQVPVLLLANKQSPVDEGKVQACGAQGHSIKPFDTQTMIDRVRALANLPVLPSASPAPWTPRPAAQPPAAPVQAQPPPQATVAPASAAQPPPQRPAAAPPSAGTAPAQASFGAPAPTPSGAGAPPAAAPRPAAQPPAGPPPPRQATPQPTAGAWSMTPAPAGSGPPPTPSQTPRSSMPRPGSPTVSGPPPAVFRAPPAAAPRQVGGTPPPRGTQSAVAGMAQTTSHVAAQNVGQALHKAGIPVDQAALMNLAREIIERIAWEVVPELAEALIREQLARQQKL